MWMCLSFVVGVLLQMFQQLVGINMMIYYSPTIFGYGLAGGDDPTYQQSISSRNGDARSPIFGRGGDASHHGRRRWRLPVDRRQSCDDQRHREGRVACIGGSLHFRLCGFLGTGRLARLLRDFPARGARSWNDDYDHGQLDVRGPVMGNALSFMKAHGNASIFYNQVRQDGSWFGVSLPDPWKEQLEAARAEWRRRHQ